MKIKDIIGKVRHLGVIVEDLDSSIETYKKLYDIEDHEIRIVPESGDPREKDTRFAFIPLGGMEYELIHPISDNFKKKLGNPKPGINHIAFTVTDIEGAVENMKAKGVRLGHVTKNGILDMKRSKVAYFNPEDTGGILIEFVEPVED